jgi:hypothetical protein
MNYVQISFVEASKEKILTPHTIANIHRHISYFEEKGGIRFETIPDNSGLGDAVVALLRFSSGLFALIGTRSSTMRRGVELLCSGPETESAILADFKEAFPEVPEDVIYTRDKWHLEPEN